MIGTISVLGVAILLLMVSSVLGAEAGTDFPRIEGKALTGKKFEVPRDLSKDCNLILVAFLREQQKDIDTWIPKLELIEKSNQNFTFYEFPVLPEMNIMARWFIYQGMRSGITSDRARARTVTFHLDKQEFRKSLGIDSEDLIQVFLVDSTGVVTWRESGTWSEAKEKDLIKIVSPPAGG